ncbi:hypothetical protein PsYK624_143840 [Phanerochaete sordida]|uniref:Uncharacterized protein n=1 Tax=Phanerochaete sordida TaxID=48140 RepID=A0A9P3GML1_9APHY|nr:hypothetical protein PsYK624_143840 [Phanerochaete sordida]
MRLLTASLITITLIALSAHAIPAPVCCRTTCDEPIDALSLGAGVPLALMPDPDACCCTGFGGCGACGD